MKRIQKGFTLVETLLVILILAVIGFGGYYVWHNQHQSKNDTHLTANSQKNTSNQSNNPSLSSATSQLQAAYTKWVTQHADTSEDSSTFIKNSGYFTTDFSTNAKTDIDPLTCGGGRNTIPPDSFSLGAPTQSDGTATISVHNTFQGNDYSTVVVTMRAKNDTWLISSTTCQ